MSVRKVGHMILRTLIAVACCGSLVSCGDSHKAEEKKAEDIKATSTADPVVKTINVKQGFLNESMTLPGELRAYQDVPIHAKVEGYISWIGVDRGSVMKKGDKMITIFCPELDEKLKESASKVSSARASYKSSKAALDTEISKQVEFQAKLNADRLTYDRLKETAKTPGAIAQNEVDLAYQTVAADEARVASQHASVEAARSVIVAQSGKCSCGKKR